MDDFMRPNVSQPHMRGATCVDGQREVKGRLPPAMQGKILILGEFRQHLETRKLMYKKVSGYGKTRDTLRKIGREHLRHEVTIAELDFQPFQ